MRAVAALWAFTGGALSFAQAAGDLFRAVPVAVLHAGGAGPVDALPVAGTALVTARGEYGGWLVRAGETPRPVGPDAPVRVARGMWVWISAAPGHPRAVDLDLSQDLEIAEEMPPADAVPLKELDTMAEALLVRLDGTHPVRWQTMDDPGAPAELWPDEALFVRNCGIEACGSWQRVRVGKDGRARLEPALLAVSSPVACPVPVTEEVPWVIEPVAGIAALGPASGGTLRAGLWGATLLPGEYLLRFDPALHPMPPPFRVRVGGDGRIAADPPLALAPGATLEVAVFDEHEEPVENAMVEVCTPACASRGQPPDPRAAVVTARRLASDGQGRALVRGLAAGTGELRVSADRLVPFAVRSVDIPGRRFVTLRSAGRVRIETHPRLAGAWRLSGIAPPDPDRFSRGAVPIATENGVTELLVAGEWTLRIAAPGFQEGSADVVVEPGRTITAHIELLPRTLALRFLDVHDAPVAGVEVRPVGAGAPGTEVLVSGEDGIVGLPAPQTLGQGRAQVMWGGWEGEAWIPQEAKGTQDVVLAPPCRVRLRFDAAVESGATLQARREAAAGHGTVRIAWHSEGGQRSAKDSDARTFNAAAREVPFDGLAAGAWRFVLLDRSGAFLGAVSAHLAPGDQDLTFPVTPPRRIRLAGFPTACGLLLDGQAAAPVDGVLALPEDPRQLECNCASAVAGAGPSPATWVRWQVAVLGAGELWTCPSGALTIPSSSASWIRVARLITRPEDSVEAFAMSAADPVLRMLPPGQYRVQWDEPGTAGRTEILEVP